ncbi:MAG: putative methyltransferase YcgJ [Syntrophorhabdus sp. PtaU1.Bin153]|nr:MAG: putative methyltransferase YcgJ [Syntrophorhabdus sp. PtaU1.Bin153]
MAVFDPIQYKKIEREVYSLTAASYEKFGSTSFEAYAQPLLEGAQLKPGQHVLDVACGTGIPSLMVSPLVEPGGTVTGIDLAPGMIELAKKKAGERGLKNVTFQEADGESLPFADESFDTVLCNHGLVHMTDRAKALREMYRVLRKDYGILALSVWGTPDRALTIGIVAMAIREIWPAAVIPGAPMWFDFGPEGVLEKTLTDAGFRNPQTTTYSVSLVVKSGEEYWEGVLGISGRLQMLLKSIPQEAASKIKAKVIGTSENFRSQGQIEIPCKEIIAIARR